MNQLPNCNCRKVDQCKILRFIQVFSNLGQDNFPKQQVNWCWSSARAASVPVSTSCLCCLPASVRIVRVRTVEGWRPNAPLPSSSSSPSPPRYHPPLTLWHLWAKPKFLRLKEKMWRRFWVNLESGPHSPSSVVETTQLAKEAPMKLRWPGSCQQYFKDKTLVNYLKSF